LSYVFVAVVAVANVVEIVFSGFGVSGVLKIAGVKHRTNAVSVFIIIMDLG
jgi:hypothetical protein